MRWLVALASLLTCEVMAQTHHCWAIPMQAATIYSKADTTSVDVVQVTSDDVLLVRYEGTSWCWAQDRMGRQGYLQRSLVRPLTEISDSAAVRWMQNVFKKQETFGRNLDERVLARDSIGTMAAGRAVDDHEYERNAALSIFTSYYCRTGDRSLLRAMMLAVAANSGSASEEPPYRLTLALECRPDEFKRTLATLDVKYAEVVSGATSTALWMRFDEKVPEQQKQRDALLKLLPE